MTFEEMKKQFLIMEGNLTAHRETNKKLYDENIKLKANLKECYTESENEINMWRGELDKLKAKNNESELREKAQQRSISELQSQLKQKDEEATEQQNVLKEFKSKLLDRAEEIKNLKGTV